MKEKYYSKEKYENQDWIFEEEEQQLQQQEQLQEQQQQQQEQQQQQQQIKEQDISAEGFKEASLQKDNVQKLPGEEPAGPKYIGLDERFSKFAAEGEDSPKMRAVRVALSQYHHPEQYGMTQREAVNGLIKACDKYCSGRFEIFKRGRGLERLQEVKALREQAKGKLEFLDKHKNDLIANDDRDDEFGYLEGERQMAEGASLGKKAVAGIAAFFGFTVVNLAKIVSLQPLWGKEAFKWRVGNYYYGAIRFQDRLFGRVQKVDATKQDEDGKTVPDLEKTVKKRATFTSTSLKDKEKSETLAAENEMIEKDINRYINEESDEEEGIPAEIEEEYKDYEIDYMSLKNVKSDLLAEYRKGKPDENKIRELEDRMNILEKGLKDFAKRVKDDYDLDFNMDETEYLGKVISQYQMIESHSVNERKVQRYSGGMLTNLFINEAHGWSIGTSELIKKEWIENGEIPEEELDRLIKDSFNEFKENEESQSRAEKKRIKERFKERFSRSIMATKTYQQAYYIQHDELPTMPKELEKNLKSQDSGLQRDIQTILCIDKTSTTEDKEEFLKEFASAWTFKETSAMTEEEKKQYNEQKEQGQKKQAEMLEPYIKKALSMTDMKKYNVKNDEELIEKFYMYRDELMYGFVLSAMVDNYVSLGGELTDEEYMTIKATAMSLQSVKAYYENRLTIMRSPYYMLIDDERLKDMTEEDITKRAVSIDQKYDNTAYKKYLDAWAQEKEESTLKTNKDHIALFHGGDAEETMKLSLDEERKNQELKNMDSQANRFREEHFGKEVINNKDTIQERAFSASDNFAEYKNVMSDSMRAHAKRKGVDTRGVTDRKIFAAISGAAILDGLSMKQCHSLFEDMSKHVSYIAKDEKLLRKKARAIEKLFDVLKKIDFDKIHTDPENIFENADLTVVMCNLGMEMDNLYTEYEEMAKDNLFSELKYGEKERKEIKARFTALMDIKQMVDTRLGMAKSPLSKTEEGKKLLDMNVEELNKWFDKNKKKISSEMNDYYFTVFLYKQGEEAGIGNLSAKQILERNRKQNGL